MFIFIILLLFVFFSCHTILSCRRLRTELILLRQRGAIKVGNAGERYYSAGTSGVVTCGAGGSLDRPNLETSLACARCCRELGRIINRGAPCRSCRLRVCKSCREFANRTTDWLCIVCHKQMWVLKLKQKKNKKTRKHCCKLFSVLSRSQLKFRVIIIIFLLLNICRLKTNFEMVETQTWKWKKNAFN